MFRASRLITRASFIPAGSRLVLPRCRLDTAPQSRRTNCRSCRRLYQRRRCQSNPSGGPSKSSTPLRDHHQTGPYGSDLITAPHLLR